MQMLQKLAAVIVVSSVALLSVAQLIPAPLTNPPSKGELFVPPEVVATLRRACYDCHSNQTRWPWYSRVAPLSWAVAHDVDVGRKEINFSEWGEYYPATRERKLKWMQRALSKEDMPPWSYRLMQPGARLSHEDRAQLEEWIETELTPVPIPVVANACRRSVAGSIVQNPPALCSHDGVLTVNFSYQTTTDADGRTLFCFMTPDGLENPTLHVLPGDRLIINVTNNTPAAPVLMEINPPNCGQAELTASSVNIHFHGTDTRPTCHRDDVIHTAINSGQSFRYDIQIPTDQPPGLYWYHPHAHTVVETALQGGASGALIVEGIQNVQPSVAGMDQCILVIRDQNVVGSPPPGGKVPSWDLTLNSIPIAYPTNTPAVIQMQPGKSQLWRVSNSSSDSILDLQVQFEGTAQTLQIVGLDGFPTGSEGGTRLGTIIGAQDILLPTGGRAEFIVQAPLSAATKANFVTLAINAGRDGDNDPQRTLATIETVYNSTAQAVTGAERAIPASRSPVLRRRTENLATATPAANRALYFSENNPLSQFFITVDGATPTLFNPNNPPAIVTTQGSVEDWTIENRTLETHEFHLHQLHFLVLAQDNFQINGSLPAPSIQGQLVDTLQVPFWDGDPSHPFPKVKVRMDFRGADIGDFVYHCHIAEHEDRGMMAVIRVMPSTSAAMIERIKMYFGSFGWFGGPSEFGADSNWCIRGKSVFIGTTPLGPRT
ncbi:MAG: heme-binding domain-containing protein [Candidatus Binataceae bacterium]